MKRLFVSLLVFALLCGLFVSASAQEETQKQGQVTITCPNTGDPIISPTVMRIWEDGDVTFVLDTAQADSCLNGVSVNGTGPIGNFNLTFANPDSTIPFPNAGTYTYTVAKIGGKVVAQGTIEVMAATPTMTQWGIIILVALIVASGVVIMLKKRKAAIPV